MTLALAIISALLVVGVSVGFFLWARNRALAEAAQFTPVSGLFRGQALEVRVALPPTCSLWRFTVCLRFAVDECARLFGERAVEMISGTRCAVHFSTKWRDGVSGQWVRAEEKQTKEEIMSNETKGPGPGVILCGLPVEGLAETPPTDDDKCPMCGAEVMMGFGLAYGGYGPYWACEADGCDYVFKRQDQS